MVKLLLNTARTCEPCWANSVDNQCLANVSLCAAVYVCRRLHENYRIGICSGVRGQAMDIQDDSFSSEEACEHAIFLQRITDLLEKYR